MSAAPRPRDPHARGFALPLVLFFLVLLALMVAPAAEALRSGLKGAGATADRVARDALLEGAVNVRIAELLTLQEEQRFFQGSWQERELAGVRVRTRILDLTARVNINIATRDALERLIAGVDERPGVEARAPLLAAAIVDWRDEDHERQPGGAEDEDYAQAGMTFAPADRPFLSVDELHMVLGMDEGLFERLAPYVTVSRRRGGIGGHAASRAVLMTLPDFDAAKADSLISKRSRDPLAPATYEGFPFDEFAEEAGAIFEVAAELPGDPASRWTADVELVQRGSGTAYRIVCWRHGE
ncbi:MAG: general secretion pathway protein GspK [Alphaproteobacteria bacterium]|nr:general secretion pathway protein GspK [Alphaproteobacteria bacterium]